MKTTAYLHAAIILAAFAPFGTMQDLQAQTVFTGTLNASGIRSGGGCSTPGPFMDTITLSAFVQPSLSSLTSNGGSASGFAVLSNVRITGCDKGAPPGASVSVTVSPGGATTMTLSVLDQMTP